MRRWWCSWRQLQGQGGDAGGAGIADLLACGLVPQSNPLRGQDGRGVAAAWGMAADGNARWCHGLEHEPWWGLAGQAGMTSGCCCSC